MPNKLKPTDGTLASTICVQGLGFVGAAMAVAIANARDAAGKPRFNVVGVDVDHPEGRKRIDSINAGVFPFPCSDEKLKQATAACVTTGNLSASSDPSVYEEADAVFVDIHLDIDLADPEREDSVHFEPFEAAIRALGMRIKPECLVIIETTVPPGTTERVALPVLQACFRERGLPEEDVHLAHSYERVMPGEGYLDSIVNFWRVYAGIDERSADRCEELLSAIINTDAYPLKRLQTPVASETAKVLENSYRATTIAFMEEWGRFAEAANFDLYEVIDAIRIRPTHSNMRQPGFGVGGYCLTKDPLFANWSSKHLFKLPGIGFEYCLQSVARNRAMPLRTLEYARTLLGGLDGKTLGLLGISYRQDVGDTRHSPSETFARAAMEEGARVLCHDPLVDTWPELDLPVMRGELPVAGADILVFAVPHKEYQTYNLVELLNDRSMPIIDANRVLSDEQRAALIEKGHTVFSIGRGAGL